MTGYVSPMYYEYYTKLYMTMEKFYNNEQLMSTTLMDFLKMLEFYEKTAMIKTIRSYMG